VPPKPPVVVELNWTEGLTFEAALPNTSLTIDSAAEAGPTPVQLLGVALAGCMSMDLAHILTRGRHPFTGLRSKLVAERAVDDPHRVTSVTLHFDVDGAVPEEAVARAVDLSRTKYCSVWHSMRSDIELRVTFALHP
jgi:putative redox protein